MARVSGGLSYFTLQVEASIPLRTMKRSGPAETFPLSCS